MPDAQASDSNTFSGSSPGPAAADPANIFSALAEFMYQGSGAPDVDAAICVGATLLIPGCHHASLLVRQAGRYITTGASDTVAIHLDDVERSTGEGPCLDTIDDRSPQIEPDLSAPTRWFQFADRAVAETPVRGALGMRVVVDDATIGALDLFSDRPNLFDIEAAGQTAVLASFATMAINTIARGEDAAGLRRGLRGNRGIGTASAC